MERAQGRNARLQRKERAMLALFQSGIYWGGNFVLYILLLPSVVVLLSMTVAELVYELLQHRRGRRRPF